MVGFPGMLENKRVQLSGRLAPWAAVVHLFRDMVRCDSDIKWNEATLDLASEYWPEVLHYMWDQLKYGRMADVIWNQIDKNLKMEFEAEWPDGQGARRKETRLERVLLIALMQLKERNRVNRDYARLLAEGFKIALMEKEVFQFSGEVFVIPSGRGLKVKAWVWF